MDNTNLKRGKFDDKEIEILKHSLLTYAFHQTFYENPIKALANNSTKN